MIYAFWAYSVEATLHCPCDAEQTRRHDRPASRCHDRLNEKKAARAIGTPWRDEEGPTPWRAPGAGMVHRRAVLPDQGTLGGGGGGPGGVPWSSTAPARTPALEIARDLRPRQSVGGLQIRPILRYSSRTALVRHGSFDRRRSGLKARLIVADPPA